MSEATLAALAAAMAQGPTAVAAVREAMGSTPRERGAWMIVTAHATCGTVGGGEAEQRAVEAARALLDGGGRHRILDLSLGPALDQCCGGRLRLVVARVETLPRPPRPLALADGTVVADRPCRPVLVYGAGHVGAALVQALAPLPFAVSWVDARAAPPAQPSGGPVPCRRLALPEEAAAEAPDETFHIVMTHSHAVDLEIVAAVLARPFGFLGLIGSQTKRATFRRRLAERGLDAARLTCPIGLPGIPGKEPAVIAAATAAQLLALDRQRETP